MKIVNINSFLEFAEEMQTRYKFYRIVNKRTIQAFVVGRDGLILFTTIIPDHPVGTAELQQKGFLETELTKDEIAMMGLL